MTKQCNNCKHWRLGTASLDDNYCNLTGKWSDYEGYCDSWEGIQMTEKRFKLKHINEQHISANLYDNETFIGSIGIGAELIVELLNSLSDENEELKKEVEMLKNGLKAYNEALPLYLDCDDIMHFNNELFEFEMERMDFYKKYPNRIHYK